MTATRARREGAFVCLAGRAPLGFARRSAVQRNAWAAERGLDSASLWPPMGAAGAARRGSATTKACSRRPTCTRGRRTPTSRRRRQHRAPAAPDCNLAACISFAAIALASAGLSNLWPPLKATMQQPYRPLTRARRRRRRRRQLEAATLVHPSSLPLEPECGCQ